MADSIRDINKEIKSLQEQLGQTPNAKFLKKDIEDAKSVLQDLRNEWAYVNSDLKSIHDSLRESLGFISSQNYELNQMKSSMKGIAGLADKLNDYRKGDVDLGKKEIEFLGKKAKKQFESLQISINSGTLNKTQLKEAQEALRLQGAFNDRLKETLDLHNSITKNTGVELFSGISDIVNSLPGLRKLGEPFQDAAKAAKEAARIKALNIAAGGTGAGLPTAFSAGIKSLGPSLMKNFGPLFIIEQFIEGLNKADKETTELKKSMALNTIESMKFRTNLAFAAASSGNINVTTSKLLETFSSINKQFGFISNFSDNTLITLTKLTQVVGIGADSANNLAAASKINGLNFENSYKNTLSTSYEMQRQAGIQFDLREILTESGKITGQIRANLGANPPKLAEAVTQSKLFGASLQEVAATASSFLDFESSISDQLQAELLLGKNINIERARAAALNGDQVTLAKELRKEAGTFADFSKMNVIQQQALSKALGMSSDQLANILFQQDLQNKSRRELVALGGEDLVNRLESQTLADKFNATMDKLKGIFTDVATAFMPVLGILGAVLSLVGLIIGAVGDLINLLGGNTSFTGIKKGWEGFTAASNLAFGVGDVISPASGQTQISTKEGGLFNLSKNDDVIATPGLVNKINQSSNNTSQNITQVNMSETNMLLRQILTKQGTVKIDNTQIGTAFAMNTYEIQ